MEIPKLNALTPFQKLVALYIIWTAAWMPSSSIIYVYFNEGGMPLLGIFIAGAFMYLAPLLAIPLFRGFAVRDFMVGGLVISALSALALIALPLPLSAFAWLFLSGLTSFAFWLPFNTAFYEFRKGNNAQLGALYYSVGPVISLLVPVLAGLFVQSFGFMALFALSMAAFAICIPIAFCLVENRRYEYSLVDSIKAISGLKSIMFVESFAGTIIFSITLGVILLKYAGTPLQFGIFTSLATIFSVVASFVAAKISDKAERRRELLLALVACFALSVIFTSLAQGAAMFILGYGLINFFSRIFFPLPLALVVDNSKDLVSSMVGREFIFAIGRLCGVLFGYLIAVNFSLEAALFAEGLALFLYIPIFENRKRKLAKH